MRRLIVAGAVVMAGLAVALGCAAGPVNAAAGAGRTTVRAGSAASAPLVGLNAVSCVSAKFCVAVGAQEQGPDVSAPLAMIWNGKRWTKTAVRLPTKVVLGPLDSVSCVSAAFCVAIGDGGENGGAGSPLAETWNGRAWVPTMLPTRPIPAIGLAVSCGAPRSCAVVGWYPVPGGPEPFVETLSGAEWTLRTPPAMFVQFGGVSCASAGYCVLGGFYGGPPSPISGPPVQFLSWNGKAFTVMKDASAAAFVSYITGVSCVSAKACTAVGTTTAAAGRSVGQSLAIGSWNGGVWSLASVAGPKGLQNQLQGLSCLRAGRCVAVGVSSTNGTQQTSHALAVSYDGRSWTTASVPALPDRGTSAFTGVSCVSATWCMAVGEGGGPRRQLLSGTPLTAIWNGKSWRLVTAA